MAGSLGYSKIWIELQAINSEKLPCISDAGQERLGGEIATLNAALSEAQLENERTLLVKNAELEQQPRDTKVTIYSINVLPEAE